MTSERTDGSRLSKLVWAREYEGFRQRLVAAREAAGLTQREVAGRIGRSQSFVAQCERGQRRVDVVELRAFAKVYRKPVTFFF